MDKIVALCKRRGLIFPASEIYGGIANTLTTGTTACCSSATSSTRGGTRCCRSATTSSRWTPRSSSTPRPGSPRATSPASPIRWSTARPASAASAPTTSTRPGRSGSQPEIRCGRSPPAARRHRRVRAHRAARVQPHVRDRDRPGPGRRAARLPAARDRAGHLPGLQDRADLRPPQAAVRHRPGRQVVSQRDHARQLHLPHAGVRADGDGVLRAARAGRQWYEHWKQARFDWYVELGLRPDHLRLRDHDPDELSHYSCGTADVEYLFPIGWSELEGIANRGDFDLTAHAQRLGQADRGRRAGRRPATSRTSSSPPPASGARCWPSSPTPTTRRTVEGETRTVLKLHPRLAPVKVAVLPLVKKDGQPELPPRSRGAQAADADRVRRGRLDRQALPPPGRDRHAVVRDDRPPVARGPHGHVRDRDSLAQERVAIDELGELLSGRLAGRGVAEDRGGELAARGASSGDGAADAPAAPRPKARVGRTALTRQHARDAKAPGDHPTQRRGLVAGLRGRASGSARCGRTRDTRDRELEGSIGGVEATAASSSRRLIGRPLVREHAQQLAGDAAVGVGTVGHR